MKSPNVAASVRQRLLTLAQSKGWEFNRVLARYGVERVICRLAASAHGESIQSRSPAPGKWDRSWDRFGQ